MAGTIWYVNVTDLTKIGRRKREMKLNNQTHKELVKEYMEKFHTVYNAMEQVRKANPYADMTKFTRALLRTTCLVNLHKSLSEEATK